jgi:hypothetical protein
MMSSIQVSLWLLIAVGCYQALVQAQLFERGNCPEVKAIPDFNLSEVSFFWFFFKPFCPFVSEHSQLIHFTMQST